MNRFGWTNKSNNMKKITLNFMKTLLLALFCIVGTDVAAQSQFNPVISGGSTSGLGRAPQGSHRFTRTHFIVTAAEMTAGGFAAGEQVNGIGFSYAAAQNIATSGNIAIYLENTTDVSNVKSTTWTTAIASMTEVSNATTTIPAIVGDYNIDFSNGSTFTYTGGNLYVAFDYQNLTNTLSMPNTARCDNQPVGGASGAATVSATTTAAPTATMGRSSFRPQVRLAFPVACARPTNLSASGATPTSANLTWDLAGAGGLEVQWGGQGFTVGSGTSVTGAAVVSPFTLSGLPPNTVYDYYVRTLCTDGSISNWNGPFTFTSLFQPSNVPYNTGFENTQFPFLGWVVERDPAGTTGNFWQTINFGVGSPNVQDGAFAARVGAGVTTATANDWIISRGVNLTAGSAAIIEFFVAVQQVGTTTPASYKLTVGTSQNVAAQTTVIIDAPTFSNTAYVLKTHSYTAPATGVYYFGIQNAIPANPTGSLSMVVDNFTVTQTLSVDSVDASNFVIYPNPANDMIAINSSNYTFNNVAIVDLNGRVIKVASFDNVSEASLDIAALASGIYFMNITSNEGMVNKKIIKN
jgi:hypothetical protein